MSTPLNPLEAAWCDWLLAQSQHVQSVHDARPAISRSAFEGGVEVERKRLSEGILAEIEKAVDALTMAHAPKGHNETYQRGWVAGAKCSLRSIADAFRKVPR